MTVKHGGLAGVVAGQTAICGIEPTEGDLFYRGYTIADLIAQSNFEEVAYLLIYGALPSKAQLDQLQQALIINQQIPTPICKILEELPAHSVPMDVLRTACSALGSIEPESAHNTQQNIALRLMPYLASCLFYWHFFAHNGQRINVLTREPTLAGHILALLHQAAPDSNQRRMLDHSLILYAEHDFNASTFAARVCVSTGTDFYGPIASAIATLAGPLHGGANEAAIRLISKFNTVAEAEAGIKQMLTQHQLIMGFGHRIYTKCDPRSAFVKQMANEVADSEAKRLFAIAQKIEQMMQEHKNIFANLDFYSSLVYHALGIPPEMFTPVFVFSRLSGWSAHIMEQRANNKLIRPDSEYIGPKLRPYVAIEKRND